MSPATTLRLLLLASIALAGLHALPRLGVGGPAFAAWHALWYLPVAYAVSGLAALLRAVTVREERLPWALIGIGILGWALGCVLFNAAFADGSEPPFPSVADALWLAIYPLTFAAVALLVRRRFARLDPTIWLDGIIGGTVVASVAAAVVFQPVFDVTVENGVASLARLAYPVGDLVPVGFAVVVWCLTGRRFEAFWALLGGGFAILAIADSLYVVAAASGGWRPGSPSDVVFAVGIATLAAASWAAPREIHVTRDPAIRVQVPTGFALTAVAVAAWGAVGELNPLATSLAILALLATVARFALTLGWLDRQRAVLAARAATDPLTGLANHRTMHERVAQEVERARRLGGSVAVVALDLDHFKAINDTHGHAEGDAVLVRVAAELGRQARPYDLVGRVGGEEFALVLPGVDADEAVEIAERCRVAVARITVHGTSVSCSGGVAAFPDDARDGHELFALADGALYWAKRSGRAQVRRYDARSVVLLSSGEQLAQVRDTLARENTPMPVFQPIVEIATGRIGGFEALSRFLHTDPVRAPDLWFAQGRRCGLGAQLEARAIANALAVPGRPPGTFLSVNLSPGGLLSPEVADALPHDLHDVVIELTEDALFSTDEALDVALAELRSRGARIAVDDAGAGYAGLQQLIRVKPDIVKLDRSLVVGVHADASKIALLDALVRFATSTGAAVCAEGIEDVEDLRTLARFDVTYVQGFALARPQPAWPGIAAGVAAEVAAEARSGMRVARGGSAVEGGDVTVGALADALARVRSREDLDSAIALVARVAHADNAAVSRVLADEGCVETLDDLHAVSEPGDRFSFDAFPTTERVVADQVLGQVVAGDPAADPSELALLETSAYRSLLMVPIVARGETVGLLELYRRDARPWTAAESDRARILAHHLGSALGAPAVAQARSL